MGDHVCKGALAFKLYIQNYASVKLSSAVIKPTIGFLLLVQKQLILCDNIQRSGYFSACVYIYKIFLSFTMRGSIHCPTKFSQSDTHIHTLPIKCACHVSPLQSRATSHTIVRVCMCKCIIQTVSFVVEVGSKSAVFLKLEGSM